MSATIQPKVTVIKKTKMGSSYSVIADVTLSNAYATGGDSLPASLFGLAVIEFIHPEPTNGVHLFKYDHTNKKMKAFSSLGTEVGASTDLSAASNTIRVLAIGY